MKQSIIYKTLFILGLVIISIFLASGYLFFQSDKALINQIREYNLQQAMSALDAQEEMQLQNNQKQMQESVSMIAKNSTLFLLNFDHDGLKRSLMFDIKKEGVKAIKIYDSAVEELFLLAIKHDEQIIFEKELPKNFSHYTQFKRSIFQNESEKIGEITLFYDESIIKNKIKQLKADTTEEIANFNSEIDAKMLTSNMVKLSITVATMIAILALISVLLIKFVNQPLKKLQIGLDNFFLFLQNKKDYAQQIELNSSDEFGQMAKNLNDNISVSAKLHEEIHELNTNLEEKIEEKTKKVTTLLNNAGQGFLTFNREFIIDDEYSKECEKLISHDIANKDITQLLFKDDQKKILFKTTLLNAIDEKVKIKQNSYISLLPSIILLNKKAIKLEYKIVENEKFMLILTNITSQKKLEKKIRKEQEILKMIVAIVSESEVFYETKKEYLNFINNYTTIINENKTPLHNIANIYRTIHTFKGTFSQIFMHEMVTFLHTIESDISKLQKETTHTNNDLINVLNKYDFTQTFENSLSIIQEILGDEFLESDNYLKVDISDISILQEKVQAILNNYENVMPEYKEILSQIQNLSCTKLYTMLNPYVSSTLQLAHRLEKEIYAFEIICDKSIIISDNYKPFTKSLIHVFRNCIDHGIETPEVRVENNKDEKGTISCNVELTDGNLHITVCDDGAGIDIDKLKNRLIQHNQDVNSMSNQDIYNTIFEENFSTKKSVSDISGRGVGMSAVKHEIEKINGEVKITSEKNIGTTLEFIVPIQNQY